MWTAADVLASVPIALSAKACSRTTWFDKLPGEHFMALDEYRKKRRFEATPEPQGTSVSAKNESGPLVYVIQKHRASQLHYDFRLEWNGVLLSWAVPKGPSLDPQIKRLAMATEDHPIEYAKFEGVIPEGEYGGGTVMLWDEGTWEPQQEDVAAALRKGDLKFTLHGEKLKGSWVLVRTRGFGGKTGRSTWLLIKHRDQFASAEDLTQTRPRSVITNRLLADIAREGGGDVSKAATGDARSKSKALPGGAKRQIRRRRAID
jgi:bifunctional non-homologous end joining protein LigD